MTIIISKLLEIILLPAGIFLYILNPKTKKRFRNKEIWIIYVVICAISMYSYILMSIILLYFEDTLKNLNLGLLLILPIFILSYIIAIKAWKIDKILNNKE
jgi:hypothetical protein